jgi:hypothetical protein
MIHNYAMSNFIAEALAERRTLEQAVADLRASNAVEFRPGIAEMIRHGEAEIRDRRLTARHPELHAGCHNLGRRSSDGDSHNSRHRRPARDIADGCHSQSCEATTE